MANPNIVNVASIYGFSISGAITTSDVDIINVTSEEVWKINTFMISNTDGANACHLSVKIRTDGSTFREIGPGIPIPPRTVLTFIDKNNQLYMEEGDLLRVSAGANSDLVYVLSGEKIKDQG